MERLGTEFVTITYPGVIGTANIFEKNIFYICPAGNCGAYFDKGAFWQCDANHIFCCTGAFDAEKRILYEVAQSRGNNQQNRILDVSRALKRLDCTRHAFRLVRMRQYGANARRRDPLVSASSRLQRSFNCPLLNEVAVEG